MSSWGRTTKVKVSLMLIYSMLQNRFVLMKRYVPKPVYLIAKRLKSIYQIPENRFKIIDEIEQLDYHVNSDDLIKAQSKINCGEWSIIQNLEIKQLVQLLLKFFLAIKVII